jgi:hypothetical protein
MHSENPPLHVRNQNNTLIVDQILHHVQTEETNHKNVFSQPDHVPSKHELPLSYMVAILTIFWPFMQMLSKYLSSALVV